MRSPFAAPPVLLAPLLILVALAGALALPHRAQADTSTAAGESALMNVIAQASQRLVLADTVARYKWLKSQDITDVPRENALLDNVTQRSPGFGVDPQFARTFFRDQIEANKLVQQGLISDWRLTPPPPQAVPDLASSIRPQLDQLTTTLLTSLARVQSLRQADDCPVRLAHSLAEWRRLNNSDSLHEQALQRALAHLCASGGIGALA